MTDAERVTASKATGNLHWVGPAVVDGSGGLSAGRHASGHVQMFAPDPQVPGSSVSHWDTALVPNEMMEPQYTGPLHDVGLMRELFGDIGWDTLDATTTTTTTTSTTTTTLSPTTTASVPTTTTSSTTSTLVTTTTAAPTTTVEVTTTLASTTTLAPPTTTTSLSTTTLPPTTSTVPSTTTTSIEDPPVCGDVSGDEDVTASDALGVLRAAVGSGNCDLCVCDVTDSGSLTSTDALATLRFAVGIPNASLSCPGC
jgi:hypothetical protein